jgi:tRNA G18 (ribose-2'-O)-methylase SpoU
MGSIFQMKILHSQDFAADLQWLKDEIVATANSSDAVFVRDVPLSSRGVMVTGNEDQGIGRIYYL